MGPWLMAHGWEDCGRVVGRLRAWPRVGVVGCGHQGLNTRAWRGEMMFRHSSPRSGEIVWGVGDGSLRTSTPDPISYERGHASNLFAFVYV